VAGKGRDGDGIKPLGAKNGRKWFEVRLTYTDPRTGKKRDTRKKIQADSKLLASNKRSELLENLKAGLTGKERKRFGEALDEYLKRPMAFSSRESRTSFAKPIRAHFGDWWIDTVTSRALQAFMDGLKYGKSSQASIKAILQNTFAVAKRKGWAIDNPARDLELRDDSIEKATQAALGKAPKRALSPEEAVAFLADLRVHSLLLYPLIATQYVVMCRFAEVSALAPDAVDLDAGLVTVRRGQVRGRLGPTKGKYERLAGLPATLCAELREYRAMVVEQQWPGADEFFFPRPPGGWRRASNAWSIDTASDHIRASFERLKLSHMRSVTHAARHTGISIAALQEEHELILRKVAGHTSLKQTLNYTEAYKATVVGLAERNAATMLGKKKEDV
jgi:integrase